ncbi:hypothetical protein MRB53_038011 [Persea americana]|nr:hypothetical protein MRB53_038011 [Persea americana]
MYEHRFVMPCSGRRCNRLLACSSREEVFASATAMVSVRYYRVAPASQTSSTESRHDRPSSSLLRCIPSADETSGLMMSSLRRPHLSIDTSWHGLEACKIRRLSLSKTVDKDPATSSGEWLNGHLQGMFTLWLSFPSTLWLIVASSLLLFPNSLAVLVADLQHKGVPHLLQVHITIA